MDKTPNQSGGQRRFVITPDQIAKLGLTAKLQSVIASQLKTKPSPKATTPKPQRAAKTKNQKSKPDKTKSESATSKSKKDETCNITNLKSKIREKILSNATEDDKATKKNTKIYKRKGKKAAQSNPDELESNTPGKDNQKPDSNVQSTKPKEQPEEENVLQTEEHIIKKSMVTRRSTSANKSPIQKTEPEKVEPQTSGNENTISAPNATKGDGSVKPPRRTRARILPYITLRRKGESDSPSNIIKAVQISSPVSRKSRRILDKSESSKISNTDISTSTDLEDTSCNDSLSEEVINISSTTSEEETSKSDIQLPPFSVFKNTQRNVSNITENIIYSEIPNTDEIPSSNPRSTSLNRESELLSNTPSEDLLNNLNNVETTTNSVESVVELAKDEGIKPPQVEEELQLRKEMNNSIPLITTICNDGVSKQIIVIPAVNLLGLQQNAAKESNLPIVINPAELVECNSASLLLPQVSPNTPIENPTISSSASECNLAQSNNDSTLPKQTSTNAEIIPSITSTSPTEHTHTSILEKNSTDCNPSPLVCNSVTSDPSVIPNIDCNPATLASCDPTRESVPSTSGINTKLVVTQDSVSSKTSEVPHEKMLVDVDKNARVERVQSGLDQNEIMQKENQKKHNEAFHTLVEATKEYFEKKKLNPIKAVELAIKKVELSSSIEQKPSKKLCKQKVTSQPDTNLIQKDSIEGKKKIASLNNNTDEVILISDSTTSNKQIENIQASGSGLEKINVLNKPSGTVEEINLTLTSDGQPFKLDTGRKGSSDKSLHKGAETSVPSMDSKIIVVGDEKLIENKKVKPDEKNASIASRKPSKIDDEMNISSDLESLVPSTVSEVKTQLKESVSEVENKSSHVVDAVEKKGVTKGINVDSTTSISSQSTSTCGIPAKTENVVKTLKPKGINVDETTSTTTSEETTDKMEIDLTNDDLKTSTPLLVLESTPSASIETTIIEATSSEVPETSCESHSRSTGVFAQASKLKNLCGPVLGRGLKRRRIPNKPTVFAKIRKVDDNSNETKGHSQAESEASDVEAKPFIGIEATEISSDASTATIKQQTGALTSCTDTIPSLTNLESTALNLQGVINTGNSRGCDVKKDKLVEVPTNLADIKEVEEDKMKVSGPTTCFKVTKKDLVIAKNPAPILKCFPNLQAATENEDDDVIIISSTINVVQNPTPPAVEKLQVITIKKDSIAENSLRQQQLSEMQINQEVTTGSEKKISASSETVLLGDNLQVIAKTNKEDSIARKSLRQQQLSGIHINPVPIGNEKISTSSEKASHGENKKANKDDSNTGNILRQQEPLEMHINSEALVGNEKSEKTVLEDSAVENLQADAKTDKEDSISENTQQGININPKITPGNGGKKAPHKRTIIDVLMASSKKMGVVSKAKTRVARKPRKSTSIAKKLNQLPITIVSKPYFQKQTTASSNIVNSLLGVTIGKSAQASNQVEQISLSPTDNPSIDSNTETLSCSTPKASLSSVEFIAGDKSSPTLLTPIPKRKLRAKFKDSIGTEENVFSKIVSRLSERISVEGKSKETLTDSDGATVVAEPEKESAEGAKQQNQTCIKSSDAETVEVVLPEKESAAENVKQKQIYTKSNEALEDEEPDKGSNERIAEKRKPKQINTDCNNVEVVESEKGGDEGIVEKSKSKQTKSNSEVVSLEKGSDEKPKPKQTYTNDVEPVKGSNKSNNGKPKLNQTNINADEVVKFEKGSVGVKSKQKQTFAKSNHLNSNAVAREKRIEAVNIKNKLTNMGISASEQVEQSDVVITKELPLGSESLANEETSVNLIMVAISNTAKGKVSAKTMDVSSTIITNYTINASKDIKNLVGLAGVAATKLVAEHCADTSTGCTVSTTEITQGNCDNTINISSDSDVAIIDSAPSTQEVQQKEAETTIHTNDESISNKKETLTEKVLPDKDQLKKTMSLEESADDPQVKNIPSLLETKSKSATKAKSVVSKRKQNESTLKTKMETTEEIEKKSAVEKPLPRKQRGRPKKSIPPIEDNTTPQMGKRKRTSINYAALNEGSETKNQSPEPVLKKVKADTPSDKSITRRSRRKKVAPVEEEEPKLTVQPISTDTGIDESQSNNEEIINESVEKETPEIHRKPRKGRPRKVVIEEENMEISPTLNEYRNVSINVKNSAETSKQNEGIEDSTPKTRGRNRTTVEAIAINPEENKGNADETPIKGGKYPDSENSEETSKEPISPRKRTRGQRKIAITEKSDISEDSVESTEDSTPKKASKKKQEESSTGKRKNTAHIDVEPENETLNEKQNRLLVRNLVYEIREQMAKAESEDVSNRKVPNGMVKCAICRVVVKNSEWPVHNFRHHNSLAWTVDEPALNLDKVTFVITALSRMYLKKKPFFCHKCNESKKSVIGFLGHVLQCKRSDADLEEYKIKCPRCFTKTMPFSILEHMKSHRTQDQKKSAAALALKKEEEEERNCSGRKREAAKRASHLIQTVSNEDNTEAKYASRRLYTLTKEKIAESEVEKYITKDGGTLRCNFNDCCKESKSLDEAREHFKACDVSMQNLYCCKFCSNTFKAKQEFYCHFENTHKDQTEEGSDFEDDGSESEVETEQIRSVRKPRAVVPTDTWRTYQLKFLYEATFIQGISLYLNHWCYSKHLEFCEENYKSDFSLFNNVESRWILLDKSLIKDYLPKLKQSMSVNHEFTPQKTFKNHYAGDQPFKKYKLFESKLQPEGYDIIFCGGPISTMSWVPTPFNRDDCQQILAVSIIPDPDKGYSVAKMYQDKNIIQFWNLGLLDMNTGILSAPKLEFCLAHEHGPIWAMEWCPSGCYRDDQLGLVAVAGTDSFVYGYRIPQPEVLRGVVYKADPVFKLSSKEFDFNLTGHHFYATRISWSKASGHEHICVGYTNGVISVFDLNTSADNLKTKKGGTLVYYPYVTFQGHNAQVTGVALYHMNGGNKWLASASLDRSVKFWNLDDIGQPISTKKKCQVKEIIWMNNWISTLDAHDDWSNPLIQTTSVTQLREFAAQHCSTVMYSFSTVNSISASDWGNIIVQGTQMGELIGSYVKHFLPFSVELPSKRFYMSYTKLLTKEGVKFKDNTDRIRLYDYKTTTDNTSLVFVDFALKSYKEVMKPSEPYTNHKGAFEQVKMDMYPVQSITNVKINPNRYSFLYTAVGYQTGFVRLVHSKFLSTK